MPSLIFKRGRKACDTACAYIFPGVSRDKVYAEISGLGFGNPASCQTLLPDVLASRSQSAQSTALRAAPAGKKSGSRLRFISCGRFLSSSSTENNVSLYLAYGTHSPRPIKPFFSTVTLSTSTWLRDPLEIVKTCARRKTSWLEETFILLAFLLYALVKKS